MTFLLPVPPTPLLLLLLLLATSSTTFAQRSVRGTTTTTGCSGGNNDPQPTASSSNCGFWMGPSIIKKQFQHGFGYGMFTNQFIPKGTAMEPLYNGAHGQAGEPLLPVYGSETIYKEHSPLREYIWDEDNMPEVAVEWPDGLTALFVPGLAAIAPCTSVNFNLEVLGPGKEDGYRESVYSSTSIPDTGDYAVRHNVTFVAVRDIVAGEELTVQCSDDDYNGGTYQLAHYDPSDDRVTCLDQNLRVAKSPIQGHGLFAKRLLQQNATILSSPVLPIHATELEVAEPDGNEDQMMLNYAYGHPDMELLWLPYGPLFNYINHSPTPNARVQWHTGPQAQDLLYIDERQQHHHPELFEMTPNAVSRVHGKSLTMDLVPLRQIQPGEEVTIDYGKEWIKAYEKNQKDQKNSRQRQLRSSPQVQEQEDSYVSAERFNARTQHPIYKTLLEQLRDPYPDNLETFCFYALPEPRAELPPDHSHRHQRVITHKWESREEHECFRPCEILERHTDFAHVNATTERTYTIKMNQMDDRRVVDPCILEDHDEIWLNVPASAIRIVDRPYSTQVFSELAFRREIGLPEDMMPPAWRPKKLRSKTSSAQLEHVVGAHLKRKKAVLEIKAKGGVVKTQE